MTIIRSPRFKRRRREVKMARLKGWGRRAVALGLVASLAGAGVAVARSSLFGLDSIEVTGNAKVADDEIVRASGLRLGTSVMRLDLDGARSRIEGLPHVREATVTRSGALGVLIEVTERKPAVVVRVGKRVRLYDVDGAEVPGPVKGRVPVVLMQSRRTITKDDRSIVVYPQPDRRLIADVLSVWKAAGKRRNTISTIRADSKGYVIAMGGVRVSLGSTDDVRRKFTVIGRIAAWARSAGVRLRSVDVSVPESPAFRTA